MKGRKVYGRGGGEGGGGEEGKGHTRRLGGRSVGADKICVNFYPLRSL